MAEADGAGRLVALEHRVVDDPAEREGVLVDQVEPLAELEPHGARIARGGFRLVAAQEDRVAVLQTRDRADLLLHRLGHELGDGPLARAVHEGDVAKAGRAEALGVRDHAVEEAARLARGPLDRNSAHDAAFGDGALEGLEGDRVARKLLGEVDNLDGDAQIRLVRAVAQHPRPCRPSAGRAAG